MRNRIGLALALLLGFALAASAQQSMYRIQLKASGAMVSLDQPNLVEGRYVFHQWPDGALASISQDVVSQITPLTGHSRDTIYQIELNPSGTMIARDMPVRRGTTYTFHSWLHGSLMSLRASDVQKITALTGDHAFWVEEGLEGEVPVDNLAMQGTNRIVEIGVPRPNETSQAGPSSLSSINSGGTPGISGAPAYGNWSYQGTPGVSDAWSPANATMSSGVPTMPAATDGMAPPTMPQ